MKTLQTIKQQTQDGKTVEYRITEHLNSISIIVYANGKHHADCKPESLNTTVQGRQVFGRIGNVYVSNPILWDGIVAAYDAAKAKIESSDEYKVQRLRQQREKLAYEVKYASDELYETERRKVEMAMQGRAYRYDAQKLEAEIATAKANLNAFDEAHPEIIALIKKERDERTERNMWN